MLFIKSVEGGIIADAVFLAGVAWGKSFGNVLMGGVYLLLHNVLFQTYLHLLREDILNV